MLYFSRVKALGQGVIWVWWDPWPLLVGLNAWDLGDLGGQHARLGVTDPGMPGGMRQCRQGSDRTIQSICGKCSHCEGSLHKVLSDGGGGEPPRQHRFSLWSDDTATQNLSPMQCNATWTCEVTFIWCAALLQYLLQHKGCEVDKHSHQYSSWCIYTFWLLYKGNSTHVLKLKAFKENWLWRSVKTYTTLHFYMK